MATPKGSGIGGFDLGDWRDQFFAFEYDGTGKLDHLACHRPGTGTIWILKKVSDNDSPDAFLPVYPTNAVLPVYTTVSAKISALFAALLDRNFNTISREGRDLQPTFPGDRKITNRRQWHDRVRPWGMIRGLLQFPGIQTHLESSRRRPSQRESHHEHNRQRSFGRGARDALSPICRGGFL